LLPNLEKRFNRLRRTVDIFGWEGVLLDQCSDRVDSGLG
jgi:hypothetical protein